MDGRTVACSDAPGQDARRIAKAITEISQASGGRARTGGAISQGGQRVRKRGVDLCGKRRRRADAGGGVRSSQQAPAGGGRIQEGQCGDGPEVN